MNLYWWYDFVAAKEGWENTGNIDLTLENLIKAKEMSAHFAVVVSAMRKEWEFNTTQMLEKIGVLLAQGNKKDARIDLFQLRDFHKDLVERNFSWKSTIRNEMYSYINEEFQWVADMLDIIDIYQCIPRMQNDFCIRAWDDFFSLKGFGEVFCAKFYNKLLWLLEYSVNLEDISSQQNNISSQGDSFENTLQFFRRSVTRNLLAPFSQGMGLTLIPWYIWGIQWGIDASIGSWYSDATAALVAVSVQETLGKEKRVLLEILKSVDGILSADPRLLREPSQAQLIERLSFLSAKEFFGERWAQAKVLNSDAMRHQVIGSGISVRLRNPAHSESKGTIIDKNGDSESFGVEAVLKRDNVAFVSITSIDMPQGYLARAFGIIQKYKSVDITATSETEFSFTVDMKKPEDREVIETMRQEIVTELFQGKEDEFHYIEVLYNQSLIFCIGQNMENKVGLLSEAAQALKEVWISAEIVSQAQQQRAMTFGVASGDAKNAVDILHQRLVIEKKK